MGKLKVISAGLFTTIQDSGRLGYRKYGVPVSGVMDSRAFKLANEIVQNPDNSPVLEITLKGGTFEFQSGGIIALTGAEIDPHINGENIPMNRSIEVDSGDILSLKLASRGLRTYMSVRGSIEVAEVLGSYSTYTTGKFGGLDGRKLQKGDVISWKEHTGAFSYQKADNKRIPYYSSKVTFTVLKGPEWSWLNEESQKKLLSAEFNVDSDSNRMGIRLSGTNIDSPVQQMDSSAVIPGIIQLPESGQPIIISQDGQTVGGYPRIAKISDVELWRLGQLRPGDTVRFRISEQ